MSEPMDAIAEAILRVRAEHAPDPRTAVFEVEAEVEDGRVRLHGATSEPAAAEALHRALGMLETGLQVVDAVERLPLAADGAQVHALVSAAAAPMLAGPVVSDAGVSQVLMGHRLLVLREAGRWLHCRSEDGYLGWVHRGYVRRVGETEVREWEMGDGGVACLSLGAVIRGEDGEVVGRIPWGGRFVREDGAGRLPGGLSGTLEGEWVPLAEQRLRFPPVGEAVVESAGRWLGAPYLWGGTTPAGVDCSGLAQATYRTHGIVLPRDSDLQARVGQEVDPGPDFANLRAGDLAFFAEEPGRITHVVLSMGSSRIVHSSLGNGGVWINDLNGELGYEQELRRLFVCARRIVPETRVARA